MRRFNARLAAVAAVAVIAQPSPTPGAELPEPVPGEEVCAIADPRLVELSGLVARDDGYLVINDSTAFDDRLPVFFLDLSCNLVDEQSFLPGRPRDPEDMALDRGTNTLWVGDTGDNTAAGTGEGPPRETVALWRIDLDGDRVPVIHRFTYPGGQPLDAEALVLDGDGTPIIVTKDAAGTAELFRPGELRPSSGPEDTVALEPVGEVTLPPTETEHRFGAVARQVVTGAASAPDGSAVVLRSYTDAFEFDVPDGDVVTALTTGAPRITPLPGEPLGEAITYSPDGQRFLTVSEVPEDDAGFVPLILSYAPTAPPPPEPPPDAAPAEPGGGGGGGLFNDLQDIINVIAAVGVIGVLLVAAGVFGIVRARRARPGGAAAGGDIPAGGNGGGAPATGRARLPGMVVAAPLPGVDPEQSTSPAAGVYSSQTARPAGTEYRGTEYGGGPGYEAAEHPGTEYGGDGYRGSEYGGDPYRGAEYRGDGYQSAEYGSDPYRGSEYGGGGGDPYRGSEYGGGGGDPYRGSEPGGAGYGGADHGQAGYGGAEHRYGPDGYPEGGYQEPFDQERPGDYYSDDPDYPYEFRGRGG